MITSAKTEFKVGTRFIVEQIKNNKVLQKCEFENLVLDCGLDSWSTQSITYGSTSLTRFCNVGSGNSTPDISQTGLDSFVASLAGPTSDGSIPVVINKVLGEPLYIEFEKVYHFTQGAVIGDIRELGLSIWSNSGYFSRSLIRDEFGNPLTITLTSDQELRITAKTRMYYDLAWGGSDTKSFLFDGVSHNAIREPFDYNNVRAWTSLAYAFLRYSMSFWFPMINTTTTTIISPTTTNTSEYVNGTFELIKTCTWNAGSYSGDIQYIGNSSSASFNNMYSRFTIDPVIPKSNTEEVTFVMKRTWGRYVAPS